MDILPVLVISRCPDFRTRPTWYTCPNDHTRGSIVAAVMLSANARSRTNCILPPRLSRIVHEWWINRNHRSREGWWWRCSRDRGIRSILVARIKLIFFSINRIIWGLSCVLRIEILRINDISFKLFENGNWNFHYDYFRKILIRSRWGYFIRDF